ncbi:MAG: EAL domain-containing protein, partial [Proteobacteria bacterium]
EKSALIHSVTRWVIDAALTKLAQWPATVLTKLSLNLSALDFDGHDITQVISGACRTHGIHPERLEVEITEGEWLRSNPQVLTQLAAIRELGVDVAIDDFGTGYSNFSYLHEIPANVVKLDKSMITGMEHSPRHQLIVQTVLELARKLGYRTVAEGVETFKCMQMIRALGCDEAQGYFFARPMPEQEFLGWSGASRFPLRKLLVATPA